MSSILTYGMLSPSAFNEPSVGTKSFPMCRRSFFSKSFSLAVIIFRVDIDSTGAITDIAGAWIGDGERKEEEEEEEEKESASYLYG